MRSFLSEYFGPMGKENCDYFLLLSILNAIIMVVVFIYLVFSYDSKNMLLLVLSILQSFVLYFHNRLLFNMCVNSI